MRSPLCSRTDGVFDEKALHDATHLVAFVEIALHLDVSLPAHNERFADGAQPIEVEHLQVGGDGGV